MTARRLRACPSKRSGSSAESSTRDRGAICALVTTGRAATSGALTRGNAANVMGAAGFAIAVGSAKLGDSALGGAGKAEGKNGFFAWVAAAVGSGGGLFETAGAGAIIGNGGGPLRAGAGAVTIAAAGGLAGGGLAGGTKAAGLAGRGRAGVVAGFTSAGLVGRS
jgi:hypothetical protein